jgi:DNA-binding beta-propeller fold protein YncE
MRKLVSMSILLIATLQLMSAEEPMAMIQAIELPSVEGRIDHLALDASGERLFVAALGNNTLEVLDLKSGTHVKSVQGFQEPQGVGFAPDFRAIIVANGQGKGIQAVDATDFGLTHAIALGDDSDNVRYDANAKTIYVGYGNGALVAIDPASWRVTGQVQLTGHPESFQLEQSGSRVFVNVPTAGHIAVVDRKTMKTVTTWAVTTAEANYPMALDEAHHRLFIGCRKPATVLVFDTTTGKQVGSAPIVGDTDDMFFDARRNRLYVIGGEGFIDVLDTAASGSPSRVSRIDGAPGARTGLLAPTKDHLYLAVPHRGAQRAEIRVYELHN